MRWGIICKMLPRNQDDEPEVRLHGQTFATEAAAKEEERRLLLQNLPFGTRVFSFKNLFETQVGDTEGNGAGGEAAIAIAEHAFRSGFQAGLAADQPEAESCAWDAYDPPEHIKALA